MQNHSKNEVPSHSDETTLDSSKSFIDRLSESDNPEKLLRKNNMHQINVIFMAFLLLLALGFLPMLLKAIAFGSPISAFSDEEKTTLTREDALHYDRYLSLKKECESKGLSLYQIKDLQLDNNQSYTRFDDQEFYCVDRVNKNDANSFKINIKDPLI